MIPSEESEELEKVATGPLQNIGLFGPNPLQLSGVSKQIESDVAGNDDYWESRLESDFHVKNTKLGEKTWKKAYKKAYENNQRCFFIFRVDPDIAQKYQVDGPPKDHIDAKKMVQSLGKEIFQKLEFIGPVASYQESQEIQFSSTDLDLFFSTRGEPLVKGFTSDQNALFFFSYQNSFVLELAISPNAAKALLEAALPGKKALSKSKIYEMLFSNRLRVFPSQKASCPAPFSHIPLGNMDSPEELLKGESEVSSIGLHK